MNYFHVHSMLSNATTIIDSTTRYDKYIEKAKEYRCRAFGFSEHGSILEWYHKKQAIEKAGMKYIHGSEVYVTKDLSQKIRDNYHVILMARNFEGFKELNKLVSKGFNRAEVKVVDDNERYYYNPRISYDELKNTSDNIILTSACLGGILNSEDDGLRSDFIEYMKNNPHKCFLEIQQHNTSSQAIYNQYLVQLHKDYKIPLIAGTDSHMVSDDESKGRDLLQKRKGIYFDNEEGWNLGLYDYETLKQMYKTQNAIDEKYYIQALDNTDLLCDLIEEYKIDTSHKYPRFSDTPLNDVRNLCKDGAKEKGKELTNELIARLNYELDTYKHNDALDFMLLEYDVKNWARENDIFYGESRGSVSGSMVAYLMDITKVDSMKYNLSFERFMNVHRQSLADIDTDWMPSKREDVKAYLHNNPKYYTAEIITFNTIAEKGSIRDIGGALDIPLEIINDICKNLEDESVLSRYKKEYPDLFKYAKQVEGTITSVGSHPAATICSPIDIVENIGTITISTNKYPISALNMKEVDNLNFVKLDVLGLDNVEIISKTCKLAGIEELTSDKLNFEDTDVWEDIFKSPVGIFQFEGDFAFSYLKQVFSPETLEKMSKFNPNINYLYLMSVANGAIRPAGQSYREALSQGLLRDNGHEALNDFLKDTNGYLVFQEQIIEFLNKFCGYTMGEADIIRRGFAKKTGTDQYIPQIKSGFTKTMMDKYNVDKIKSEELITNFIQVIEDASDYLFSLNHALPYSMIGYMCGWLRYYYPMEFIAVLLEINADNQEKTSLIYDYMNKFTQLKVVSAKFRYSRANYTIDKQSNSIYKGMTSIKYISDNLSNELYALKDKKYKTFYDLLIDIKLNVSCSSKQLDILIKLDFFSEFGKSKRLLKIVELLKYSDKNRMSIAKVSETPFTTNQFERYSSKKTPKTYMEVDFTSMIKEVMQDIPNEDISISEKAEVQLENLGYVSLQLGIDGRNCYITSLDTKFTPRMEVVSLNDGKNLEFKIKKDYLGILRLKVGDLIFIHNVEKRQAWKLDGKHKNGKNKFAKIDGKFDLYIDNCEKITEEQLYRDRSDN